MTNAFILSLYLTIYKHRKKCKKNEVRLDYCRVRLRGLEESFRGHRWLTLAQKGSMAVTYPGVLNCIKTILFSNRNNFFEIFS